MSRRRVRVLIVDDHGLFAEALAAALELDERFAVVGQARDGVEAVELAARLRPDAVVMDLHMPRLDGAEATRRILAARASRRVVMVSSSDDPVDVERSLAAGAARFLTKGTTAETLIDALLARRAAQRPTPTFGSIGLAAAG
jgi:DNA-binding NarL/FixJ family response regulator